MSKRDETLARLKAQLAEWTAELHRLEAGIEAAEKAAGEKYRHSLDRLHEQRLAAEARLESLKHAGEETWDEVRDEAEKAWKAFKAGVEVFRDFSDHT